MKLDRRKGADEEDDVILAATLTWHHSSCWQLFPLLVDDYMPWEHLDWLNRSDEFMKQILSSTALNDAWNFRNRVLDERLNHADPCRRPHTRHHDTDPHSYPHLHSLTVTFACLSLALTVTLNITLIADAMNVSSS